jgi:hypothetical protein
MRIKTTVVLTPEVLAQIKAGEFDKQVLGDEEHEEKYEYKGSRSELNKVARHDLLDMIEELQYRGDKNSYDRLEAYIRHPSFPAADLHWIIYSIKLNAVHDFKKRLLKEHFNDFFNIDGLALDAEQHSSDSDATKRKLKDAFDTLVDFDITQEVKDKLIAETYPKASNIVD